MPRFSQLPAMNPDYSLSGDVREKFGRRVLADPYLRKDWEFGDLDKNYPIKPVLQVQKDEQRRLVEQDIKYKKSIIENRDADLRLRESDLDIDMYESALRKREAALDQIPIVKEKLNQLDPRDQNFMNDLFAIEIDHPIAFENKAFVDSVISPLINRNERFMKLGSERKLTLDDANKALKAIQDINRAKEDRVKNEFTEDEEFMLTQYGRILGAYKAQQGYQVRPSTQSMQEQSIAPQSTNIAPQSGQPISFSSVDDAESANLPKGTIVYINGRKARID